jgi:hypothetical protein
MQPLRTESHLRSVPTSTSSPHKSNIVIASLWMIGITLALFFLPVINGLIGGFVGGRKAGSIKRALAAAILPAIVAGLGLWGLLTYFDLPVIGAVAGAAVSLLVLLSDVGIFIGAAIGGKMSQLQ